MLGTNDFQSAHDNDAWLSSQGSSKLIDIIRQAPIEPDMPVPDIILIAPPKIVAPKGDIAEKFKGAENRCVGLANELDKVAKDKGVYFFDAGKVTEASLIDGIHLDQNQHQIVGEAIAEYVLRLDII